MASSVRSHQLSGIFPSREVRLIPVTRTCSTPSLIPRAGPVAKKLKRSWVEVQKIKSKWKAQKRKEGFPNPTVNLQDREEEIEDVLCDAEKEHTPEVGKEISKDGNNSSASDETAARINRELKEKSFQKPSRKGKMQPNTGDSRISRSSRDVDEDSDSEETKKPSLRELTRTAYSRSSLHSHKSDPLHKRKEIASSSRSSGETRQRRQPFGGEGKNGGIVKTGRGQPDMKLRMGALLERIKRDHS